MHGEDSGEHWLAVSGERQVNARGLGYCQRNYSAAIQGLSIRQLSSPSAKPRQYRLWTRVRATYICLCHRGNLRNALRWNLRACNPLYPDLSVVTVVPNRLPHHLRRLIEYCIDNVTVADIDASMGPMSPRLHQRVVMRKLSKLDQGEARLGSD
jgi:hypothetical protein